MAEDTVRTVGRYGILREIGRGGMGVVYLARQLDLDRLVALKEMAAFHAADPALARRFVRESRLAGSVVHANVVTVFDYFEHAGTPYIAMELVERGSLRPYVGGMAPAQIGGVLEGLLAGLGAAEQRGIVHRDLKPENLMVTADGRVKIADFGIAKATQTTRTSAFVTATGTTIGTPQYMAPEQAMARDIGPWTDLYSVGCIAYELFGGAPPFHDADTPMAIMLRHINDPLPPVAEVAGVNRDISDWIERLTAKDRHDRPQTANDAWEALEEVLIAELGPRWRRESRLPEPPSRPATAAPTSSEYRSFAWEPTPSTEIAGIDVEGTGPDTGNILPTAPTTDTPAAETAPPVPLAPTFHAPAAETPPPPADALPAETAAREPTAGAPPAETARHELTADAPPAETVPPTAPAPTSDAAAAETVPPAPRTPATGVLAAETVPPASRTPATGVLAAEGDASAAPPGARLAVAGAIALFAAVLLPLVAQDMERWNVFAVLGPLEAAGTALATLVVAQRLRRAEIAIPLAAGILIALGTLSTVAALALAKFVVERLDPAAVILVLVTRPRRGRHPRRRGRLSAGRP